MGQQSPLLLRKKSVFFPVLRVLLAYSMDKFIPQKMTKKIKVGKYSIASSCSFNPNLISHPRSIPLVQFFLHLHRELLVSLIGLFLLFQCGSFICLLCMHGLLRGPSSSFLLCWWSLLFFFVE